ncbi:hypothetical protein, partial [Billgrantia desiderata]
MAHWIVAAYGFKVWQSAAFFHREQGPIAPMKKAYEPLTDGTGNLHRSAQADCLHSLHGIFGPPHGGLFWCARHG